MNLLSSPMQNRLKTPSFLCGVASLQPNAEELEEEKNVLKNVKGSLFYCVVWVERLIMRAYVCHTIQELNALYKLLKTAVALRSTSSGIRCKCWS